MSPVSRPELALEMPGGNSPAGSISPRSISGNGLGVPVNRRDTGDLAIRDSELRVLHAEFEDARIADNNKAGVLGHLAFVQDLRDELGVDRGPCQAGSGGWELPSAYTVRAEAGEPEAGEPEAGEAVPGEQAPNGGIGPR